MDEAKHYRKTCKTQLRIWTKFFVQYILRRKIISACKFTSHSGEIEGLTYCQGGGPAHKDCNIGWKMKCQGTIILQSFSILHIVIYVGISVKIALYIFMQSHSKQSVFLSDLYFHRYISAFLFLFSSTIMVESPGVWECRCWE